MLPTSMDDDLEGGAKEAMKKLEGRKVCMYVSMYIPGNNRYAYSAAYVSQS